MAAMEKKQKTISVTGVGIKDVARLAGVSPATVSRALSGGPVSEALRAQVEAAVRASGYRPNLAARRLRSQHSGTVGLVVADIRNPFFTGLSRAVEDSAYQAGMRVILCNTDEDPQREALYLRLMQEERVSGLIFAPTRASMSTLDQSSFEFPVVLVDRAATGVPFDAVVLDNRAAAAQLVNHLVARGYRRIGGLFGKTSITGAERRDGYVGAMQRHGLESAYRLVVPTAEAAYAEAAAWFAEATRPQALVVSNSLLLVGVLKAARAAGLCMPADLALAGFDNDNWTELVEPGITVIEQPVDDIGRSAMGLLFERLQEPQRPLRRVVLSGRCIVRGSTAVLETAVTGAVPQEAER